MKNPEAIRGFVLLLRKQRGFSRNVRLVDTPQNDNSYVIPSVARESPGRDTAYKRSLSVVCALLDRDFAVGAFYDDFFFRFFCNAHFCPLGFRPHIAELSVVGIV